MLSRIDIDKYSIHFTPMHSRFIVTLFLLLTISCVQRPVIANETPSVGEKADSEVTQIWEQTFEVVAWVDDPYPMQGERVMLYGSLIKSGVHLGGMAMLATWPDQDQEPGMPNCNVQVIYGSGVCIIETDGYPVGVFVPVSIWFEYEGKIYKGQTGFTPQ